MSLLTATDLAFMQTTQEAAMPGTVVIERYSNIGDGMGGNYQQWAAVGTAIGRIYPQVRRGMAEMVGGAQVLAQSDWFATLPAGTDVTAADRLLYNSRTWEVTRVNNDEMWATCVRCEVEANNEERRI